MGGGLMLNSYLLLKDTLGTSLAPVAAECCILLGATILNDLATLSIIVKDRLGSVVKLALVSINLLPKIDAVRIM